jgi:protein involved in sex pheromone biosynthesis
MKKFIPLLMTATVLVLAGCQKESSDAGNTPSPNSMQPSGADTNAVPGAMNTNAPVSGTNAP